MVTPRIFARTLGAGRDDENVLPLPCPVGPNGEMASIQACPSWGPLKAWSLTCSLAQGPLLLFPQRTAEPSLGTEQTWKLGEKEQRTPPPVTRWH